MGKIRVGHGIDIHPFASGRRLVLGGVEIPYKKGLAGHSDADVVLHAISDALLGAAGLPDIGHYFPPDDPHFKDADSANLLGRVRDEVVRAGFTHIENIDVVIMAEKPRLLDYMPAMKRRIAEVLRIKEMQIGIKATTCEKLGFVGREEGIVVSAVCLISAHD